jgi:hypothetical protein
VQLVIICPILEKIIIHRSDRIHLLKFNQIGQMQLTNNTLCMFYSASNYNHSRVCHFFSHGSVRLLIILFLLFFIHFGCRMNPEERNISNDQILVSPDQKVRVVFFIDDGQPSYELYYRGEKLLDKSKLGLQFKEDIFGEGLVFVGQTESAWDTVWHPVYGTASAIHDHHNELSLQLADKADTTKKINIRFRAFNDGIAFRYEIPKDGEQNQLIIVGEKTTWSFPENFTAWAVPEDIEYHNIGPLPVGEISRAKLPVTLETGEGAWMSINEAALYDYSTLLFISSADSLTKGIKIDEVPVRLPFQTPWRVIQLAESAPKLVESNILLNLNEPCKIEDPSWIKPGKSMWDWRSYQARVGDFVYGTNEESFKRYIDFAADNQIEYVLFDWYWRKEVVDEMPGIIAYASSKGVGVILYFDRWAEGFRDWTLEEKLPIYKSWGAKGIKYGFLGLEPEVKEMGRTYFVKRTHEIIQLCSNNEMLINFHDNPMPPTGERRTWPNMITREYCWAQQDRRSSFEPITAVTVPFVNNLSGPLDITNGFYDLNNLQNRLAVDKNGLNSTVVSETARCLVMWSPLLILPDHGEAYQEKADLFEFIKNMPAIWDETIGLAGYPGESITVARRTGNNWFVGSINNEDAREFSLKLDFLPPGNYEATIFADAPDTHFKTNKEAYQITQQLVNPDDTLTIKMAPGGGHCLWIKKIH